MESGATGNVQNKKQFLTAKFQIGSCKGPTSFNPRETVFHPDDIPAAKRENKERIKAMKLDAVMGKSNKGWNSSTYTDDVIVKRRQRTLAAHDHGTSYQYNFRAEVLPVPKAVPDLKPRKFDIKSSTAGVPVQVVMENGTTINSKRIGSNTLGRSTNQPPAFVESLPESVARFRELPIHPNLENKSGWNGSTTVTNKEWHHRAKALDGKAKRNSQKFIEQNLLARADYYKNPEQRVGEQMEEIRRLKKEGKWKPVYAKGVGIEDIDDVLSSAPNSIHISPRSGTVTINGQVQPTLSDAVLPSALAATALNAHQMYPPGAAHQNGGQQDSRGGGSYGSRTGPTHFAGTSIKGAVTYSGGGPGGPKNSGAKKLPPRIPLNRFATRPTERIRSYHHSGVWEYNPVEGQHMWSDTGSFEAGGPGDVVKVKNPNAYNFASPTDYK